MQGALYTVWKVYVTLTIPFSLKYIAFDIQVLHQLQNKAIFTLLRISATYCSHHQGATILQRHKHCIVHLQMVNIH